MCKEIKIEDAKSILIKLGMPKRQQNDRSALCLLALVGMEPGKSWEQSSSPLIGITPIIDWVNQHYKATYKPNTRESFRRRSIHYFMGAGICLHNPDIPDRATNSQDSVYQIDLEFLDVLRGFGTDEYETLFLNYQKERPTLAEIYAKTREMAKIPLQLSDGRELRLSAGKHSELIKDIIIDFGPTFIPDGILVYVGDTKKKYGFFEEEILKSLGVNLDPHGKIPDVVIYDPERKWLFLIESVNSHGPVDGKRYEELKALFANPNSGLIFVSAFSDSKSFKKESCDIAWESEVWIADNPSHMIHFNGSRFLGPYES
ncbi:MAG: BsuBI/PstI family type II restriction endonuclease [Gallionella sp.]|jgi:hypothetical protein